MAIPTPQELTNRVQAEDKAVFDKTMEAIEKALRSNFDIGKKVTVTGPYAKKYIADSVVADLRQAGWSCTYKTESDQRDHESWTSYTIEQFVASYEDYINK